jgi:predicted RNA binding protein YcfA (HicA-like mRNA interferase family)
MNSLLLHLGFQERTRGSHHVFFREDIEELLNVQSSSGKAKPYQVRQTRDYLIRHGLGMDE